MNDPDLVWLKAQRAEAAANPQAMVGARAALVADIERARRCPVRLPLAAGGVLAAAVTAVLLLMGTGGGGTSSVENAAAAPLTHLAAQIRESAAPSGDATLILRTQTYPDKPSYSGYDLYLDNGTYFFAPSKAGLPAAIAAGSSDGQDNGWSGRDIAAAKATLTLPLAQARQRMATAELVPGGTPKTVSPADGAPLLDPATQLNAEIWSNSIDALIAGAGQPDVRSGVLTLLASIPQVTTRETTLEGAQALELTASVFPGSIKAAWSGSYQEHLFIDAHTGVPMQLVGGIDGQTPSVIVTYKASRVTASNLTGD